MNDAATIDILLATWNGERYLPEQIDSILAQTYPHWRLLARDDGSADGTPGILARYAAAHPGRVVLIEDGERNLGACGNFGRLMEHADADYVMFSDQDDVWLPDKAERLLDAMKALEGQYGPETPLLVHSDLKVVGPDLEEWHPSFIKYLALNPGFGRCLNRLLAQNVVTGCASLSNRALIERARPVPPEARMHDWWVALVAVVFGGIGFVAGPTVLYRQHGANALGANEYGWLAALRAALAGPAGVVARTRNLLDVTQRQAAAFLAVYGEAMDGPSRGLVRSYAELRTLGYLERRLSILKNRFMGSGFLHKVAVLILC